MDVGHSSVAHKVYEHFHDPSETGCGMKEEDAGQNIVIPKYTGGRFYCLWLNGEEKDRVLFRFKIGSLRIRSLGIVIKSFADKKFVFGRNMFQIRIA